MLAYLVHDIKRKAVLHLKIHPLFNYIAKSGTSNKMFYSKTVKQKLKFTPVHVKPITKQ